MFATAALFLASGLAVVNADRPQEFGITPAALLIAALVDMSAYIALVGAAVLLSGVLA